MNIYNTKYQVFISSTYNDLTEARNEVIKLLLNLHQLPIGMEMFSADNDEQWTVIQETIDKSDYYILIVGQRYGTVTKEGVSYTEKEYDYAVSVGIPVMVFVRDDQVATTPGERDAEPEKAAKLKAFRAKVASNKMANFWKTEAELAQQVQTALVKAFIRHPRTGWVRADQVASPQVISELAALSQENRALKMQVEHLLDLQNHRKPKFDLLANGKQRLDLTFLEYPKGPFDLLKPIFSAHDFPSYIQEFYNVKEVENYNRQLTENSVAVEEYNKEMTGINRIINGSKETVFTLRNIGKAKANEVYIELFFPPQLLILRELPPSFVDYKLPAEIKHPIKSALAAYQNMHSVRTPRSMFGTSTDTSIDHFQFKDNKLTIRFDSLLHTRSTISDDKLFVCPLARGNFSIDVAFVCEEFDEVQHDKILIDVI